MPSDCSEKVRLKAVKLIEHSFIFDTVFLHPPSKIALSALFMALEELKISDDCLDVAFQNHNTNWRSKLILLKEYDYEANNNSARSVEKKLNLFTRKYADSYFSDLNKNRSDHLSKLDAFGKQFEEEELLSKKRKRSGE